MQGRARAPPMMGPMMDLPEVRPDLAPWQK